MPRKVVSLVGKRFGMLSVLKEQGRKGREIMWRCLCDCGNEKLVRGGNLKQGSSKSCGCDKTRYKEIAKKNTENLKDQIFGRLKVLSQVESERRGALWLCRCDCGAETVIPAKSLKSGDSTSCGCAHLDAVTTHGVSRHPLYGTWIDMIARCHDVNNSAYKRYGKLGIEVCQRWRESPVAFFVDMGERPNGFTLDRIDGTKGYTKSNCRWASNKDQQNNRRNNLWFLHDGKVYNCKQLCSLLKASYSKIRMRLYRGLSPSEAFETDVIQLNYEKAVRLRRLNNGNSIK